GLLLLAMGARDSLGLGELAVVLLLVDLAIVRIDHLPAASGRVARMVFLARSNWPPSATFAGATLAVIGALQASLVLGLLAAIMLAALQLAPLLDRQALASGPERPRSSLRCASFCGRPRRRPRRSPAACGVPSWWRPTPRWCSTDESSGSPRIAARLPISFAPYPGGRTSSIPPSRSSTAVLDAAPTGFR